jgi:hypothetical protein
VPEWRRSVQRLPHAEEMTDGLLRSARCYAGHRPDPGALLALSPLVALREKDGNRILAYT